jgi:hypothetical protein
MPTQIGRFSRIASVGSIYPKPGGSITRNRATAGNIGPFSSDGARGVCCQDQGIGSVGLVKTYRRAVENVFRVSCCLTLLCYRMPHQACFLRTISDAVEDTFRLWLTNPAMSRWTFCWHYFFARFWRV